MSTLRYFTNSMSELEDTEHDLEENGIPRSHIHVLSLKEGDLIRRNLPVYSDWSKRDIFHHGLMGAVTGLILSAVILAGSYIYGVESSTAWTVIAFICLFVVGFCTWEGGLFGVSTINHKLADYEDEVSRGAHLMVVDAKTTQEEQTAERVIRSHPLFRRADKST